jgi:hypothetical protein
VLLVALAGLDALLGRFGLGDGLVDSDVPAITLGCRLRLESVLAARDLHGESVGAILVEVGCVGLSHVSRSTFCSFACHAHQVDHARGMLLLVGVLDEVKQAFAGLAGPCDDWVSDLGLLAAEVLGQVGGWDRLLAEPEVLLGEAERAAVMC